MGVMNWRGGIDPDKVRVIAADFETDPFKHGRIPEIFAGGIYDGESYRDFWGTQEEVTQCMFEAIQEYAETGVVFFHNGGKFDFIYMKDYFRQRVKVVNGSVFECYIGKTLCRDSYAALPVALKAYKKTDIAYEKMEADVRDKHRKEIMKYLKDDCVYLWEMVSAFVKEFGFKLTMASAAMKELEKFHEYERVTSDSQDEFLRRFYYGGHVECLEKGILYPTSPEHSFHVYDVNSMYPHVMRTMKHPVGTEFIAYTGKLLARAKSIDVYDMDFAEITVKRNDGCLPSIEERELRNPYTGRMEKLRGLSFNRQTGTFFATGHEIRAGIDTGRLEISDVKQGFIFPNKTSFAQFIDHFWELRQAAKKSKDKARDLFYKLVMNSAYGKFAQNPDNYRDWCATITETPGEDWDLEIVYENGLSIWSQPTKMYKRFLRYNVATAASITGAARAELLRGIHVASRPVYCDTDSIICEGLDAELDDKKLGAWKHEAEGWKIAIAGKKLYALFDEEGKCVKQASKGARLSPEEIVRVAQGEIVRFENEAPTFSLIAPTKFISRNVRMTV